MAGEKGFEPLHAGIKIRCLNQLGDSPTQLSARTILHPMSAAILAFIHAITTIRSAKINSKQIL
jgi:hypothetical protein